MLNIDATASIAKKKPFLVTFTVSSFYCWKYIKDYKIFLLLRVYLEKNKWIYH